MLSALMGNRIDGLKNMFSAISGAQDPNAMLSQMAAQNPMVKRAMDIVQENGGDAKAAFYNTAKSLGIDPDSIMGMLK